MGNRVEKFEDLHIWQEAVKFAAEIYEMTDRPGIKHDFGLKNQIRDAVVSISSNIAEGFERRSRKEYLNFLNIAKASAGEVRSQLHVTFRVGYLDEIEHRSLHERARYISGSIANHMKSVAGSGNF